MSEFAPKELVDGALRAFEEFKATNDARLRDIEKKGAADPVVTDKLAKIETALNGFENLNQKLTLAEQEAKNAKAEAAEMKEALERIETRLNRPGASATPAEIKAKRNAWARAVVNAVTQGEVNLNQDERKAIADVMAEYKVMSITPDTTGGYLAPSEFVAEILKGVTLLSPMRSLVRVRQTANRSVQQPKRTGQFAAQWTAENATRTETTGLTYGQFEIVAHELYAMVDVSQQNLEDSAFNLEGEIREEAVLQFAKAEGTALVSGSGVGQPEGLLTNADVLSTNSGAATSIADADGQANGMITLMHALPTFYAMNGVWVLNRATLGSVRKMKDADKGYIWAPGVAVGQPNTILGHPYVEMPDMPNEGANTFPIAFGDFARAYTLVDRVAMTMLRDPYTQAASGNIRLWFRRRLGGQIVLAEAVRKLKCAA